MIWTRTLIRPYQTPSSPSASTWMWSLNIWWDLRCCHSVYWSSLSACRLNNRTGFFVFQSYCLKVKEMDDEEYSSIVSHNFYWFNYISMILTVDVKLTFWLQHFLPVQCVRLFFWGKIWPQEKCNRNLLLFERSSRKMKTLEKLTVRRWNITFVSADSNYRCPSLIIMRSLCSPL